MSRRIRVKPSKGQSIAGFFTGLLFCAIGLFYVMPSLGPFGIVWTLFAVIITVVNGINAFTDKGIASHEITVDDGYNQNNMDNRKTPEERLKELQSLYEEGMITAEEYQKKRDDILKDI